jgi:hypothetical protein
MYSESDGYAAWATIYGNEITFFYGFITQASVSDVAYVLLHEGRHSVGQHHASQDYDPTDSDEAYSECLGPP